MSALGEVMHLEEARQLIEGLREFDLSDYCSKDWVRQDEVLQRLNMQAHVNAVMKSGEFIMDECVAYDKVKLLIYDLLLSETWKAEVRPLLKAVIGRSSSTRGYLCIFHESVVLNLLEVMMFHRTAVEEAGDALIQLIDYCYRKLVWLNQRELARLKQERTRKDLPIQPSPKDKLQMALKTSPEEEHDRQYQETEFALSMMALTVTRYISDCVKYLELGMIHHLVIQCDILCVLVPLVELRPWVKVRGEEREVWDNGKWGRLEKQDYGKLPKVEAQVWLTIYNIFMDPDIRRKYELNQMRKSNLLRLRKYMNEALLDQFPALTAMLRALEELSMMAVPSVSQTNPFVVQIVPQIRQRIRYNRDWASIAKSHAKCFELSDSDLRDEMKRLADLYSSTTVEGLIEGFKCGLCKKEAFQRCKRCKQVWYCSRECQVGHWPSHKKECKELVDKAEAQKQSLESSKASLLEKDKTLITELD